MRALITIAALCLSACTTETADERTVPEDFYPAISPTPAAVTMDPPPTSALGCRVRSPQPQPPPTSPPTGAFNVQWVCSGACGQLPVPALTRATRVTIAANGTLEWSRAGTPVASHPSVATGNCRRVAADDADGCRAWYELCGAPNTGVYFAHWFDPASERWQTWYALQVP